MKTDRQFEWYEFFAGGGMARLGLGSGWQCTFSNEWCEKKASAYRAYFGPSPELRVQDIASLHALDLPGSADLAWASFPCQDLSLAGTGTGLRGARSGTFHAFAKLISNLRTQGRPPSIVVLENVLGTLSSHEGRDFEAIIDAFAAEEYSLGAMVVDAIHFLPQSRPRLFVICVRPTIQNLLQTTLLDPHPTWHPPALRKAYQRLPAYLRERWLWWHLPRPATRQASLSSMIEDHPTAVSWHSADDTERLLGMMSATNRRKLDFVKALPGRHIGAVYRRTRPDESGAKTQRAEVRFDGISGCLRTPVGGSSRQTIVVVENGTVRSRLLSPREAARLMGVPEEYPVPQRYNDAYHLFGDGVAVPVVAHLEKHILHPLLEVCAIAAAA